MTQSRGRAATPGRGFARKKGYFVLLLPPVVFFAPVERPLTELVLLEPALS